MRRSFSRVVPGFLVLLLVAHVVGAFLLLPRLTFRADLNVSVDGDPRVAAALADEKAFPTPNPLVAAVPFQGDPRADETLAELKQVVETLEAAGLATRSALSLGDDPAAEEMFLNPARDSWLVLVPTRGDGQAEARAAQALPDRLPGVMLGGEPWARFLMDRALARNLLWLFPLSLGMVALIFWGLVRRPGAALWLTFVSTVPALDVLFLFPALGLSFDFTTVLAPLLVLALTKKYNLWVHRYLEEKGPEAPLFHDRGRAIAWSASISSLGFATLLLSPVPSLRQLGLLLVFGLAVTLFWALAAVPALARAFPARPRTNRRGPEVPDAPAARWVLGGLLLLAVPGAAALTSAVHWSDYLAGWSSEARELAAFEQRFPAWQEAVLRLDGPEEGWWTDPARWKALGELTDRWQEALPGSRVVSVRELVGGLSRSMDLPAVPGSPEDLAQRLELLPPDGQTGKLISGDRRSLVVRLTVPAAVVRRPGLTAELEAMAGEAQTALPDTRAGWSGPLYRQLLGIEGFLRGELAGTLGFFGVTGALIMLRLRSVRRGLWAMLPSVSSALLFAGLAGWLHWPFSPATALVVAACIGQSTDDGLLWGLMPPSRSIRRFFAESTLLLCGALAVLAASSFSNMAEAAGLVIAALLFSTAVVLWVLPWRVRS